ncbi:MAG: hypothetical protein GY915_07175 [bacterium]|nr:hypothetical protein [bacterium]
MEKMDVETVAAIFTRIRQSNGMLHILEDNKNNPEITLGELQKIFKGSFSEDPGSSSFSFANQYQHLVSLFAYICLVQQTFLKELPDKRISELDESWGLRQLNSEDKELTLRKFICDLRNSIVISL